MRRRSFLAALSAGTAVSLGGCLDGEVAKELSGELIRVDPGSGWEQRIEDVDGSGEISYTVRSEDQRFQVYYFRQEEYEQYRAFMTSDDPEEQPKGASDLHKTAVYNEERDVYEASVPDRGGRMDMEFENPEYFVVDYSTYGIGLDVDEYDDTLRATVTLQIVEDRFDML